MEIPIPGIMFAAIVSLGIFYYYNRKATLRREEKRERLKSRREGYMNVMPGNSNKNTGKPSDTFI
jgi:hypothetical protein